MQVRLQPSFNFSNWMFVFRWGLWTVAVNITDARAALHTLCPSCHRANQVTVECCCACSYLLQTTLALVRHTQPNHCLQTSIPSCAAAHAFKHLFQAVLQLMLKPNLALHRFVNEVCGMQLVALGYDSDREGYAALESTTYECTNCDLKVSEPEVVGRITLALEDDGTRASLWTKPSLVQRLVAKPGSEWGEVDSPERKAVERMLNEWIGKRYRATVNIQNGQLYVVNLVMVDDNNKKRRTN